MRRKCILTLILCLCLPLFCSCSELRQVENLGFAIILGVDSTDEGEIEITVQLPKITGQQGDPSGKSPESNLLIYSATGASFEEALSMLQWAVPRMLDLSQIKLIVVSEALAQTEALADVLHSIMAQNRIYSAARLAICEGRAKKFIQDQDQTIGTHVFTDLEAMFEDYTENGFIPDVNFADIYYKTFSVYSDPLAIYAVSKPSEGTQDAAPAASLITPNDPKTADVETKQTNRFLGAAVLHEGVMVGTLTGNQMLYCKLLRGNQQTFPFIQDGRTIYLTRIGYPRVKVDIDASPMTIAVKLRLSVLPNSQMVDLSGVEEELEKQMLQTVDVCKAMNAEPFQFAENAARSFATLEDWEAFDWNGHFKESVVQIDVSLRQENA